MSLLRQNFDPLFTEKFFTFNEENPLQAVKVDFPLPSSEEKLKEFMGSEEGQLFRNQANIAFEKLIQWTETYHLQAKVFSDLQVYYLTSDLVLEDDTIHAFFTFYQKGIPNLVALSALLESNLLLSFRIDIIQNLLTNLEKNPTTNTHIHFDDAYSALKIGFPVPTSAETLADFFKTEGGVLFKESFSKLVDELIVQLEKLKLDKEILTEKLNKFRKKYFDYEGLSENENAARLSFYREGVVELVHAVQLFQCEEIPFELRSPTLQNLVESIALCAPSAHTHISDAKLKLLAHFNLPLALANIRTNISREYLLEEIKILCQKDPNDKEFIKHIQGNEIHYVNAVLNEASEILGIKKIEDENIKFCNEQILKILKEKFFLNIHHKIHATTIIKAILLESNFTSAATFSPKQLANFENKLKFYGMKEDKFIYKNIHQLVYENPDESFTLSYKAHPFLFINLFFRLCQGGHFKIDDDLLQLHTLESTNEIIYSLKNRFIYYSYVQSVDGDYQPFTTHCIKTFLTPNQESKVDELISIIKRSGGTIMMALIIDEYLQSPEFNDLPFEKQHKQTFKLANIIRSIDFPFPSLLGKLLLKFIERRNIKIVQLLLACGVNPNSIDDKSKKSALMVTAGFKDSIGLEMVKLLLQYQANPDYRTDDSTVLREAIINDNLATISVLLNAGADPNLAIKKDKTSPLMTASARNKLDAVKLLLEKGADVNQRDSKDNVALLFAIVKDEIRFDIFKLLLNTKANPNSANALGLTPLIFAAAQGCERTISELIEANADINQRDNSKTTALMHAVIKDQLDVVKLLLEKGADFTLKTLKGETATHLARKSQSPNASEIVKILLAHELFEAVHDNNLKKINTLLTDKADPNVYILHVVEFSTSLNFAVFECRFEIVEALLDKGNANPNLEDPLSWAIKSISELNGEHDEQKKVIQKLLDAGANPNFKLPLEKLFRKYSTLRDLQEHEHSFFLEIADALIQAGANVNGAREIKFGSMKASNQHADQVLPLLNIKSDEDPDNFVITNFSLLHLGVLYQNQIMVEYLLDKGANIHHKASGISVIELARALLPSEPNKKDKKLITLLEEKVQQSLSDNMETSGHQRKAEENETTRNATLKQNDFNLFSPKSNPDNNNNRDNNNQNKM